MEKKIKKLTELILLAKCVKYIGFENCPGADKMIEGTFDAYLDYIGTVWGMDIKMILIFQRNLGK